MRKLAMWLGSAFIVIGLSASIAEAGRFFHRHRAVTRTRVIQRGSACQAAPVAAPACAGKSCPVQKR